MQEIQEDVGLIPESGRSPGMQPTPVFLLGKSHGQGAWAHRVRLDLVTKQQHALQFSRVPLFAAPWTAARQASLSYHHQLLELTQTRVH